MLTDIASLSIDEASDVMKVTLELSDVEECNYIFAFWSLSLSLSVVSLILSFVTLSLFLFLYTVNIGMVDMHPLHLAAKYAKASTSNFSLFLTLFFSFSYFSIVQQLLAKGFSNKLTTKSSVLAFHYFMSRSIKVFSPGCFSHFFLLIPFSSSLSFRSLSFLFTFVFSLFSAPEKSIT